MTAGNGGVQVVWFKRDLRITDHAPLHEAARRGPCICLFVYEPDVVGADDFDASHLEFINESLAEVDAGLRDLGAGITLRSGTMPDVLDEIHEQVGIAALWSHQETGNGVTYARDRRVRAWARRRGVRWMELPGHGVVRRLASRDGWSRRWLEHVSEPIVPTPPSVNAVAGVAGGRRLDAAALGLTPSARREAQAGGASNAHELLETFLDSRGVDYSRDMSSPVRAWSGCSRLSPYLAWGNVSMRETYQRTQRRVEELKGPRSASGDAERRWRASLKAFAGRLRWHCHFIQKLEDEPEIEFHNMSRAYDGLREEDFDAERFEAWASGQTGFPMVDACMRALHHGGWINFRMRAMLVSFASYQLWLHWRPSALHLARLFLDYEPGIHYAQVQMQSGVTGINTFRVYSPIKQARDQDPSGEFIRRFCPELAHVPAAHLAEPHRMPLELQRRSGCVVGRDYPAPIVDHGEAYRLARARMYAVKGSQGARDEARRVFAKHGSRRGSSRGRGRAAGRSRAARPA